MKVIGTIIYTAFIALLLATVGLLLFSFLPIPGNIEVKIVKSGSMEPSISTGAVVVIKPMETYRVGDVITFGEDTPTQVPTTHRIVEIGEQGGQPLYYTKGDANEERDPEPTPHREVIGAVLIDVPYAGYVLDFARQPLGFALLVGVPAGMIILEELFKIFQEIRRMQGERRGRHRRNVDAYEL